MTSKSVLIRPHTEESGEDIEGGDDPRGQVMAAGDDDEDDMAWLEEAQYPHSDDEDKDEKAEHEFLELQLGFDLRMSERDGVAVGGEEVSPVPPRHHQPRERARGITRPVSLTKTQRKQHYLEGHANYHPGCPFCVRCSQN